MYQPKEAAFNPPVLSFSQSDGSTETLSVMDVDEPAEHQQLPLSDSNLEGSSDKDSDQDDSSSSERSDVQQSAHRDDSSVCSEHSPGVGPDSDELEPQLRSLSMDSAYGTFSPESLQRELQLQLVQREGEEAEEGVQEVELGEAETEEEEEATRGSQLSVVQFKPRRRPPVQSRLKCLQRLSSFTLSRSEDNLLQRVHGDNPVSRMHSLSSDSQESHSEDTDMSSLAHSRSLSELRRRSLHCSEDCSSTKTLSDKLGAGLSRAEAVHIHRAPAGLREETQQVSSGHSDPSCQCKASADSAEMPRKKRSPAQQHKKLTVAQLYRIRTTLVLNSTLTAS